ncbi:hypothetical protein RUM43_004196 [Polyplax serrata]|uniref:Uncharacterized protein n=1 Tax=Polyplax serrata TaxID=468196 RepID=A0AAN8SBN8_POLSC
MEWVGVLFPVLQRAYSGLRKVTEHRTVLKNKLDVVLEAGLSINYHLTQTLIAHGNFNALLFKSNGQVSQLNAENSTVKGNKTQTVTSWKQKR